MKAVCWYGKGKISVESVAEPTLLNPRDALVRITHTAICGSDLHLYDGRIPTMMAGDILGHEFMGEVVEVGTGVERLRPGDRVVVPFPIACGNCSYCRRQLWSACDNSNPNAWMAEKLYGYSGAGLFGYSHMMGGYAGGQAQFARVPFADVGPIKVPDELSDEQVLFLSDILPTGYMAAENCAIQPGDTVAVWGCGPVGQFAIQSAFLLGAGRVIAIDRIQERLDMARTHSHAEVIHHDQEEDAVEALKALTGGVGPDACIDAVGMEAHGYSGFDAVDRLKQALSLQFDRAAVVREAAQACRKGGTLSLPGVYAGWVDNVPLGTVFGKGLRVATGQTHCQRYLQPLLERIQRRELDPEFVITHRLPLSQAPDAYRMFRDKSQGCVKVVLDPWAAEAA